MSTTLMATPPDFDRIPTELRALPRWVTWKAEGEIGKKPRKVPYNPTMPNSRASSNDPATWGTYDQACAAWKEGGRTGVGIVLNGDGLAGVDLDHCVDEHGTPSELAMTVLNTLQAGYIEVSPSGSGLRAFGYAEGLQSGVSGTLRGLHIELYTSGRYLTLTGRTIKAGPLVELFGFTELADHIRRSRNINPATGESATTTAPPRRRSSPVDSANATRSPPIIPHGAELDRLVDDLGSALEFLSADSYENWFRYGLALKTLGEPGGALWTKWSASSAKHDDEEAAAKWDSLRPEHTDFKVVFADAQAAGWVNPGTAQRLRDGASLSEIDIAGMIASSALRKAAGGAVGPLAGAAGSVAVATAAEAAKAPLDEDDGLSGLSHAPVFDYGMCPGILGRFIESETKYTEAPPIGVLANLVTRLSADIGRTAFLRMGHKKSHVRINWLCAGPTALGRKGTAADIANVLRRAAFKCQAPDAEASLSRHALPDEAEAMLAARTETSLSTGEGLIAMLRTTAHKDDADGVKPPGLGDHRLLANVQEFAGLLKKASGKEATLSARLRESFDGDTLANTSASNTMQAECPHIVINASVPEVELVRLLQGDSAVEATNGLLNRFVITYQSRDKIVAAPAIGEPWTFEQMADAYRMALATAWGHTSRYSVAEDSSIEIKMSDEARERYSGWYIEAQGRVAAPYVLALLAREADFLQRYAALLALLRGSLQIEAVDIDAGKLLLGYWLQSLEFIFSQGQQTAEAQKLEADARKLFRHLTIGAPRLMSDLKDVFTAPRRRAVLDWAQRQSPPMVTLSRAQKSASGRRGELVTRLV